VESSAYLQHPRLSDLNSHGRCFTGIKIEIDSPPHILTPSDPSGYLISPTPPTPAALLHRRCSDASSVSWDSGCESSLPSTPGGPGDYGSHPRQLSYTDSLLMDGDTDGVYSPSGSAISHGIAIAPKLLSLPSYPNSAPMIPQSHPAHPSHTSQYQHQRCSPPMHMGMGLGPSPLPLRSMSSCGALHPSQQQQQQQHQQQQQQQAQNRKSSSDSGLDCFRDRFSGYSYPIQTCSSPQELGYSPDQYSLLPAEYQSHGARLEFTAPPNCNEAAMSALHLRYLPRSPMTPGLPLDGQLRKHAAATAKKAKGAALGRLPVVVSNKDKPHACSVGACSARFKRQEHLRRHERTHTDERPFGCNVCGRKFSRTDNLRMHRKTHMKKTGRNLFVPGLE